MCFNRVFPGISNRTKSNRNSIQPNPTPIVRLRSTIDQNRIQYLFFCGFDYRTNGTSRTQSSKIRFVFVPRSGEILPDRVPIMGYCDSRYIQMWQLSYQIANKGFGGDKWDCAAYKFAQNIHLFNNRVMFGLFLFSLLRF